MHLRRLLGIVLLVIGTSIGLVGPAVAAPYGPHTGAATVSKTRVEQGDSVSISGDNFCANASVRLTVTSGGHTVLVKTVRTNAAGVAATRVRLTHLGRTGLTLRGCMVAGERNQALTASVLVVPHHGGAHANHSTVNRGDRVGVGATGFCRNARVLVRVSDDGTRYQSKVIHANRQGVAETAVILSRAGRTTITLQGCSKKGGTVVKTTHVTVRHARSFRASSAAYVDHVASQVSPVGYAAAGGGLFLLFAATQLTAARRRRSS